MCRGICLLLLVVASSTASLEIRCGAYHNCVFEPGATDMKCWGWNIDGQLGYGDTNDRGDETNEMGSSLPFLNLGSNFVVEEMRLGREHSCAMSVDRDMKCFGRNAHSQLGFDGVTTTGDALPFLEFGVDFNLLKISAGTYHTCVLSTDAALKCFGSNDDGQCGAGTTTTLISGPPSQINAIDLGTNFTPVDVDTWNYHVCVLSQQQTVKCFGDNYTGQLGYGDTTDRGRTPDSMGDGLPIVNLGSNFIVEAIATGGYHTCALSTTNTVKCWGCGAYNYGQCGTPHSTETGDDLPVLEFGADFVPTQLALGLYHTCILSEAAALICFGRNNYGQLGIGSTTDVDTPSTLTGIALGSDFVPRQAAAGLWHTCAVSTNDGVKCWGRNSEGQLGLGHTNNMGDGAKLPFVDVAWPALATTAGPTTALPTSKKPTASPTTPSPTSLTPTTAMPSRSPTVSPSTTEPTTPAPTTMEPTSETPSPETVSPTVKPTNEPKNEPITTTTLATTVSNYTSVTVTIRANSLSSTQILIAIANVYNLSSTPIATDGDGFATVTVELLVAVTSNTQLDYDVIEATLREAMVEEYGDDIEVDIDAHDDSDTEQSGETESNAFLGWRLTVALCIASLCFCFAVVGLIKCVLVKRRRQQHDIDNRNQLQGAPMAIAERPQPLPAAAGVPNVNDAYALNELRVVPPGVVAFARENAHVEDTRGEDNLSLPAQESVLHEDEGIDVQNEGRRQSQQPVELQMAQRTRTRTSDAVAQSTANDTPYIR